MKQVANEIMTKKVAAVRENDSVIKAYQIMREKKIRHLPVVDSGGDILGIVSNRDLQRAMIPSKTERDNELSLEFNPDYKVKDFMSWPVRTVRNDTLIQDVAAVMLEEKISAVIVAGGINDYRGIITTDDLVNYLINLIKNEATVIKTKIEILLDDAVA